METVAGAEQLMLLQFMLPSVLLDANTVTPAAAATQNQRNKLPQVGKCFFSD